MKWFSISGILEEVKRVRWPKKDDMFKDFTIVMVFTFFFGTFFVLFDLLVALFLKVFGIGAGV